MKDMLLTYNEYNKELGYVQGMSDLLAPIYAVMQDDAVAFWGFVKFMERMVCLVTSLLIGIDTSRNETFCAINLACVFSFSH
jgi:Rab-GTPase-TBC domain